MATDPSSTNTEPSPCANCGGKGSFLMKRDGGDQKPWIIPCSRCLKAKKGAAVTPE